MLFRYGVVVLFGMALAGRRRNIAESRGTRHWAFCAAPREKFGTSRDRARQRRAGHLAGTISLKALLPEHVLIIADAIATNLILAHDERNVSAVFDVIEPLARDLAEHGRTPGGRRTILKHIGNALLVQQRMSVSLQLQKSPTYFGSGRT